MPKKSGSKRRRQPVRVAPTAIQIGTGAVTTKPFGASRRNGNGKKNGNGKNFSLRAGMDAFHPAHLSLPQPIGPYTVLRLTQRIQFNDAAIVLGPFGTISPGTSRHLFSTVIGISSVAEDFAMNAANNAKYHTLDALGSSGMFHSRVTPSAFSVQVLNPTSVQNAGGQFYFGRLNTKPQLSNTPEQWSTYGDRFVSYNAPRMVTGGKLALRGVQLDAIPFNFGELIDFNDIYAAAVAPSGGQPFTWDANSLDGNTQPYGFAPIVLYNPANNDGLELLVTMELRCRFDTANPAQSTHRMHKPHSNETWSNTIGHMVREGHGCIDLVERVASTGMRAASATAAIREAASALF